MKDKDELSDIDSVFESRITRIIEEALIEDIGMGDLTTDAIVPDDLRGRGEFLAKESGIIAGLDVARSVYSFIDPDLQFQRKVEEGTWVEPGKIIATVEGPVAGILKGERTALNFIQRMSGIASLTRKFVDAVRGTSAAITDTRKTAPGLRIIDKRAVVIGGGTNHRFGLDDMVLIKDNHIAAAGSLTRAVDQCRNYLRERSLDIKIEVETRTLAEVREAIGLTGIDRIMLDNFSPEEMKKAVAMIDHKVEVEASGNVSLDNVRAIAETGVDYISIGALTHSVKALDVALNITATRS